MNFKDMKDKELIQIGVGGIPTIGAPMGGGSGSGGGGGTGAVDSVNGKTGVVVLNATDVGAASAAQGAKADTAIQEIKTINGNSLVGSGNIVITEEAVVFDGVPTQGSVNGVTSGGVFDYTKSVVPFVATSNNLADAVAEVLTEERCVGKIVEFTDADGNHKRYRYMGKYYTDVDWASVGAWIDVDNQDKYNVYYFKLCPTAEGSIIGDINSSGEITSGTKVVSDYLEIPEVGVSIGGGFLSRYVLYDENKTKVSTAVLYGGKTFSRTDGRYVRVVGTLNWKFGYKVNGSGVTPVQNPHVEVIENYENLVDYNDDEWATYLSPYIRLKKGETIMLLNKGTDIKYTNVSRLSVRWYDLEKTQVSSQGSLPNEFTMPIDGYIKIGVGSGGAEAQRAINIANNFIVSKSVARTRNKKRLLVVGDSISILTYNALGTDVKQGYPWFTAIEGEHDISVTNQAVSGQIVSQQYSSLQDKDLSVYDAITILIGTNDWGYNSTVENFKTNLSTMINYILTQKPSIKIGLMTLIHRASAWDSANNTEISNAVGAVLSQFAQAIREVSQEYSIPVLDLWNECQCNFNYERYVTNYSPNSDGTHPTNEAHKLFIYPLYREFIKKLFVE